MRQGPENRPDHVHNRRKLLWIALLLLLLLAGLGYYWYWMRPGSSGITISTPKEAPSQTAAAPEEGQADRAASEPSESPPSAAISAGQEPASAVADSSRTSTASTPPTGSYPHVSASLGQEERKEAFGLHESVDHVVQAREPFQVQGEQWTIDKIRQRLGPNAPEEIRQGGSEPILHPVEERPVGRFVKRSIGTSLPAGSEAAPSYYGVRLVRPGENLWNIHYQILREYFARRGVHLSPWADEPAADGRSTGIGKILKFLEHIVYVYDVRHNTLVEDINRLYPNDLVVFFKISDVFAALDQVSPQDLEVLRFVGRTLRLERDSEARVLLDTRQFEQEPPPMPPPMAGD